MRRIDLTRKFFYGRASPSASPNWRLFVPTWKYSSPPPSGKLLTWRNPVRVASPHRINLEEPGQGGQPT